MVGSGHSLVSKCSVLFFALVIVCCCGVSQMLCCQDSAVVLSLHIVWEAADAFQMQHFAMFALG